MLINKEYLWIRSQPVINQFDLNSLTKNTMVVLSCIGNYIS